MPPKYDLVLFDLDGTLADTDKLIIETMYYLYDKYRDGIRTPLEQIYYFSGPPIKETLEKEFPNMDSDKLTQEFADISLPFYEKYVTLFPHALETLNYLKNQGIKLGIVTSKSHNNTLHCLKVLNLLDLIPNFVAADDVKNIKPDPEGIFFLMNYFSIKNKEKVLYIGDNKSDYLAAKNAGIDVALVTWGPRKIDYSLNPNYWLNDFIDLEDIVCG